MFNWTEEICCKCKEPFLMSICEKEVFENGVCSNCIDPFIRYIRNKVVMGYYDLPEVVNATVDSVLIKEFERRKYPRIVVDNNLNK